MANSDSSVTVTHRSGDSFAIRVRHHEVVVDQPVDAGGDDVGPTPTELFVAGLASCIAFYAGRYLRRHGLASDRLQVECAYRMAADRPARVSSIEVTVIAPGVPESRCQALMAMVEHCTVHNSLRIPPDVRISLVAGNQAA